MTTALSALKLDALWVVYPGDKSFSLAPKARALPLAAARQYLRTS